MAIEKKVNVSIVAALVEKGAKVKYKVKKRTLQVEEESTRNCLLSAADHGNRCRNCVRKIEKLNDIFFVYSAAAMVLVQSSRWNAVLSSSVMQRLVTTLPSKSIHNHLLVSPGI